MLRNITFASVILLAFLTSCTLALSETEIKDTKGNIQEGTKEDVKPNISPSLTVPAASIP